MKRMTDEEFIPWLEKKLSWHMRKCVKFYGYEQSNDYDALHYCDSPVLHHQSMGTGTLTLSFRFGEKPKKIKVMKPPKRASKIEFDEDDYDLMDE